MVEVALREADGGSGALCAELLAELPEWFGLPDVNEHYVEVVDRLPTVIARREGTDVGLLSVLEHGRYSAEIYLLAVRRAYHRRGIGRLLLEHAERSLSRRGVEYLQVKTLSERRPDAGYAATRSFYHACGFRPLEEFPMLWGADNPALQMVKRL